MLMTDDGWQPDSDESGGGVGGEVCRGKGQQCCSASSRCEFSEFCHQYYLLLLAPELLGPGEVTRSELLGRKNVKLL